MQGSVLVEGKPLKAIRLDRDSNGRWSDALDRLMLDTNGDGTIDSIGERMSYVPVCQMHGKRFVLQSDMEGGHLAFSELTGLGRFVPRLPLQSNTAQIDTISGAISSRDGVRVAIDHAGRPIDCPVGDYRVESLTLDVSEGESCYRFQFSNNTATKHPISVDRDQSVAVDLLGELTLSSTHSTVFDRNRTRLVITPLLTTSSGLYLTGSKTGRGRPASENRLMAHTLFASERIETNSSGFS